MPQRDAPSTSTDLELEPHEFAIALLMAATWYFGGPLGLLPTLWFAYVIVRERPAWLVSTTRLLPTRARRQLAAGANAVQTGWQQLTSPWHPAAALPSFTGRESTADEWSDEDPLAATGGEPAAPPYPFIALDKLAQAGNILIVASPGSGKTTLLHAILERRRQVSYVLDPHNAPGKWPTGTKVIGGGRDFARIYAALQHAEQQLTARARQLNVHAGARFASFTLAGDEWGSVCSEISPGKEADPPGRLLLRLLKEGRKFGISFVGCGHGDTAESLGSKGDTAAFRLCFDWIVYAGGFVARELKDAPAFARTIPLGTTPEGKRFPLVVVALSPITGERRLLDLRAIQSTPGAASHPRPEGASQTILLNIEGAKNGRTDGQVLDEETPADISASPDGRTNDFPTLRERDDLIRLLVKQGWKTTQIREVVKGTNLEIGATVRRIEDELSSTRSM